tara:strand:+ start:79 stop:822 length:744 start_codon:yes stop_codon:yes gene_type:complete
MSVDQLNNNQKLIMTELRGPIVNYDFKNKWESIILPLLETIKVKSAIKRGIKDYIKWYLPHNNSTSYRSDVLPYYWARGDGHALMWDQIEEEIIGMLEKNNIIMTYDEFKKKHIKKDETRDDDDDDDYDDEIYHKYDNYKYPIINPYIRSIEKKNWRSYVISGACHSWNTSFGYTLAKMVQPNEKWRIQTGCLHTTVVNKENTRVFDINLYDETKHDFDGLKAFQFACFEGTRDEWTEFCKKQGYYK